MAEQKKISIKNKRASYDYEILDRYVAGIALTGTEIKSLRLGKASLVDSYCYIHDGELYVRGMNISEYHWGSYNNHQPRRERKLLLNRKELDKIIRATQDNGVTIVGLKLFINDRGLAKLEIGVARGRKTYDKREYIKQKDTQRDIDRVFRK